MHIFLYEVLIFLLFLSCTKADDDEAMALQAGRRGRGKGESGEPKKREWNAAAAAAVRGSFRSNAKEVDERGRRWRRRNFEGEMNSACVNELLKLL